MIGDTITITYNATPYVLNKVNQDNFGAVYYLNTGLGAFNLTIKHTIPKVGGSGESHLVRLDTEHYDAEGQLTRVNSTWMVIRTDHAIQDTDKSKYTADALVALTDPTFVGQLVARES